MHFRIRPRPKPKLQVRSSIMKFRLLKTLDPRNRKGQIVNVSAELGPEMVRFGCAEIANEESAEKLAAAIPNEETEK